MVKTQTPKEVQMLRGWLRFLTRADVAVIRSALVLERFEQEKDPPEPAQALKHRVFTIGGFKFRARATREQLDYLGQFTADLGTFTTGLLKLLMQLNTGVYRVICCQRDALNVPSLAMAAEVAAGEADLTPADVVVAGDGDVTPPQLGCCMVDGQAPQPNVTQAFCDGIQGTWNPGPCPPAQVSAARKAVGAGT